MEATVYTIPQEQRSPLSDNELARFRALITEKIEKANQEVETLKAYIEDMRENDDADSSSNAHHMADVATDHESMEMYYALIARTRNYIRQLQRAQIRIDNKTYGICRATGLPIPKGRLLAVPHTRYSLEAKLKGLDK
ncbi:MAG: TraR/DksA family transcriptional regulator [Balneolaceae bacterium]